jgi:hypothetical protein
VDVGLGCFVSDKSRNFLHQIFFDRLNIFKITLFTSLKSLIILTPRSAQSFVTSRDLTKFATEDEEHFQYALLSYRTPSTISSIPQQRKFEFSTISGN